MENNDDFVKIIAAGFICLFALAGLGGGSHNEESIKHSHITLKERSHSYATNKAEEKSLARDFESAPDVIEGMDNIPVRKEKGELSRAIEPNHRVNNLNGLVLE